MESSSFKTLEALVTRLVEGELIQKVQAVTPGAGVRLRVEKPAAIATADGPAVEIYRITNVDDKVEGSGTTISA